MEKGKQLMFFCFAKSEGFAQSEALAVELKEIRKHFNNRFVLILDDYNQSRITSGRSYFQDIKELLEM